jgi:hypothetical protein
MTPIAIRTGAQLAAGMILLGGFLGGCQQSYRPRASAATVAACRTEVDRVYAKQNRGELSYRDQRDTPFAAGYLAGNTTQGLSSEYGRDNMYSSCLNNAAGPDTAAGAQGTPGAAPPAANVGRTFTPAVR